MLYWSLLSAPQMAALGLLGIFLVLLLVLFSLVNLPGVYVVEWLVFSVSGVDLSFPILLDSVSVLFSMVVVLISFSVMLFSVSYMSGDSSLEYFIYMVMFFVFSMNLLIFIPHLLFLLLGWDGLGLTSYLLVIYYQNDSSLGAGMVTAMTNRIGDALLILAGSWCFIGGQWFSGSSFHLVWFVGLSCMVAAMTKSAQIPFSAWLPAAMAAPTPVSSLVHSSTLVTAGVYLLIRFSPSLYDFFFFSFFIFYSGVVTCGMASLAAIHESDLKKVIALSTLSQLGVMMMALGLGFPSLAFFHLVTHALFKALLFVCAGTIIHSVGDVQDVRMMGSVWGAMPVTSTCFNLANLALCGFPFMAGFYSKDLVAESFLFGSYPFSTGVFLILSLCLTSAYSIRLSFTTLWSPYSGSGFLTFNDESRYIYFSFLFLLIGAVAGGSVLSWVMCPSLDVLVFPLLLKCLVLVLVALFGLSMYLLISFGVGLRGQFFMGSMWFLGFITSSPLVGFSFHLGDKMVVQESTWMEMLSGKGVFSYFHSLSSEVQLSQDLSFSRLFSLFFMGVLFMIFLF